MLTNFNIMKSSQLQEANIVSGDMLFCNEGFSDYELYQILEYNHLKTTEKNLRILKEGLESGKYLIEDEIGTALKEEFKEYLNEDPMILGEDILVEGKLLNTIRWKLAKFSLRFLDDKTLNTFFKAYAEKQGMGDKEIKAYLSRSRKEKIKQLRLLCEKLPEDKKKAIINSDAARKCEKAAALSGVSTVISAASTGLVAARAAQATSNHLAAKAAAEAEKGIVNADSENNTATNNSNNNVQADDDADKKVEDVDNADTEIEKDQNVDDSKNKIDKDQEKVEDTEKPEIKLPENATDEHKYMAEQLGIDISKFTCYTTSDGVSLLVSDEQIYSNKIITENSYLENILKDNIIKNDYLNEKMCTYYAYNNHTYSGMTRIAVDGKYLPEEYFYTHDRVKIGDEYISFDTGKAAYTDTKYIGPDIKNMKGIQCLDFSKASNGIMTVFNANSGSAYSSEANNVVYSIPGNPPETIKFRVTDDGGVLNLEGGGSSSISINELSKLYGSKLNFTKSQIDSAKLVESMINNSIPILNEKVTFQGAVTGLQLFSSALAVLASFIFPQLWAVWIVGGIAAVNTGIGAARTARMAHKATTLRRDEIMKEIKNDKEVSSLKESTDLIGKITLKLDSVKNNDRDVFYKIFKGNTDIGKIGFSKYDDIRALGIGSFEIKPEYRGNGFGTEVIKQTVKKYKNNYDLIYCYVDHDNYKAISLYKKLGKVSDKTVNDDKQYFVEFYRKTGYLLPDEK